MSNVGYGSIKVMYASIMKGTNVGYANNFLLM